MEKYNLNSIKKYIGKFGKNTTIYFFVCLFIFIFLLCIISKEPNPVVAQMMGGSYDQAVITERRWETLRDTVEYAIKNPRIDDAHPQFIDMSKVDIEVKTELVANSGCFFSPIKSLKFDSAASWRHYTWPATGEYFEVVVHDAYRPSMSKMPQITLGAAGHTTPTLDLSTLTDALDGTRLGFYAGSTVTVDVGQRDLTQSQKLVSWTTRPTNVSFKLMSKSGSYRAEVRDDGLYASSGVIVIFK